MKESKCSIEIDEEDLKPAGHFLEHILNNYIMYQLYFDNISKVSGYLAVIQQLKDDIAVVNVSNEIIENFGKRYCRIYIEIKLKEHIGFEKEMELEEAICKAIGYYLPRYFSFHLGTGGWSEREGTDGYNREEETHYNYIWHLLAMKLEKDKIKVVAAPFVTIGK